MSELNEHTIKTILLIAEKIIDNPQTEEEEKQNRNYVRSCFLILNVYVDVPRESFPTSYDKINAYLLMLSL